MTAEAATRASSAATRREYRRSAGRVRLRTLVLIRWVAVAGQGTAILVVHVGLGFALPLGPALLAVIVSALLNVAVSIRYPPNKRLSDRESALYLAYDILQLAVLMFLTGGLGNPFSILMLVPVTISATILSLASTVWLAGLALACISALAVFHLPLPWKGGGLVLDPTYLLGIWSALSLGMLFLSAYAWRVAQESRRMTDALAETQMALAREQRLSALGSLAAAAAHELGTPLGTIAVVAKEISRELPRDSAFADDVALLSSQAARCREILKRLSAQPGEGGETPFDRLPLGALVEAAAAPHRRGEVEIEIVAQEGTQPVVARRPELSQGLLNLIENAVDFARHRVRLVVAWDQSQISIEVIDDGPGFASDIVGLLGEPYVSSRRESGGMGLGVFIARTLLERTGAEVSFSNLRSGGARVALKWPRAALEVAPARSGEGPHGRPLEPS
ncbi:MAG: ActS/PrrB/RegB family redox-sensitive histidine kinase [Alphaproteobacteria bacterium]|nr:ActS/PrrB/RegB family redox-sensitive histidine kinase [Alphaproteobacteria bacterium]